MAKASSAGSKNGTYEVDEFFHSSPVSGHPCEFSHSSPVLDQVYLNVTVSVLCFESKGNVVLYLKCKE